MGNKILQELHNQAEKLVSLICDALEELDDCKEEKNIFYNRELDDTIIDSIEKATGLCPASECDDVCTCRDYSEESSMTAKVIDGVNYCPRCNLQIPKPSESLEKQIKYELDWQKIKYQPYIPYNLGRIARNYYQEHPEELGTIRYHSYLDTSGNKFISKDEVLKVFDEAHLGKSILMTDDGLCFIQHIQGIRKALENIGESE